MIFNRFPLVMQRDAMQCGVACLASIARYHGSATTLGEVAKVCHATTEGVSLKAISDGAAAMGLKAKAGRMTLAALEKVGKPCIIHWNQNHFVVFRKKSRGRYLIADPGKGLISYTAREFCRHWISSGDGRGIAMTIEPGKEFRRSRLVDSEAREGLRFLYGYIRPYRKYVTHILLGLLIGCCLQLIMPFLTQTIVDVGIRRRDISFIWLVLLGELMIVVGRTATDFVRRWLLLHISMRVNVRLVSDFFVTLLRLPMGFFDTKLTGDLIQRMGDHSRVQNFLTGEMLGVAFSLLSFLVFGTVLFIYSLSVFWVFVAGSVVYALWLSLFLSRRKVLDYELFEQQAINQNKTYQLITSMQEIKLQNCEQRRRLEWEDTQADLMDVQLRALKLRQFQEGGSIFINEVKNIVITVCAATAVIEGYMTLGAMLAVQYIIGQLNSPVEQIMNFILTMQDVKLSLERINDVHRQRPEDIYPEYMTNTTYQESRDLSVERMTFRYDPHAPSCALENINLVIPEGKVTAIVGASGSGKTTLIKMLLNYYRPEEGQIRLGRPGLGSYHTRWWRNRCGVVMQEGVIFSESIARNIAVGDEAIDPQRLVKAARIANIHDFIMGLPLQYDTKIGRDGVGLSQGQKQRVLIARAVYKNPDFIFLDEATNALDAANERIIVENLREFYKGRTVVIVAHRLSTVCDADNIVVLDHGRIVETGSHRELVDARGEYYNLIKNQLELGA